jgi:D-glycerate 3-kinase
VINTADLTRAINHAFDLSLDAREPARVESDAMFADWHAISNVVAQWNKSSQAKVIAVSGSQGSGKSTMANILSENLRGQGVAASACSLDDFYLTRAQRAELARDVHPLLQTRGVPGTHEWQWLQEVLSSVQSGATSVTLPQFDKGLDDRVGTVSVTPEVLILEGWCVGVTPQSRADLVDPCNVLEAAEDEQAIWRSWVNAEIEQHYLALWSEVDFWIHLRVPSFAQVLKWRTQQEQEVAVERRMDSAQIERFIQHYERLTRWMWQQPAMGPGLVVSLDEAHKVAGFVVGNGSRISGI